VEEGPLTVFDDGQLTGNRSIPYEQLTAPAGFQLRAGAACSPRKLANDRNRISATYLNRGYLNADVMVAVQKIPEDPHRVSKNLFVTFSTDVSQPGSEIVKGNITSTSVGRQA
jgi:outer membrane protein assembly factor BamA